MAEIVYVGVGSGGDHIRRWWWRSYTEALAMVAIIYSGVGGSGDHIRRRRCWWRSYSEVVVDTI